MQIHRTRPSPVRRADPVADLAREFDCPRVAGHPAHREQFQGRDGGLVRGGHNGAFGAPGQEDLPRCLRGGGRNRAHRSCASRRSWYLADCTRSMVANFVTTPLGDTRWDPPNRDLRPATTPDRCCIRSASPGTESAREHRPASQPRCVRPLDGNDRHDSRRPADLRKADPLLQSQGRPPTQQGPNGLPKVHRTGWGDHAVSRTGGRLHVQRNARMHLRSGEGSDTMALRRRRIVISR